jgi:hypothetical protein
MSLALRENPPPAKDAPRTAAVAEILDGFDVSVQFRPDAHAFRKMAHTEVNGVNEY